MISNTPNADNVSTRKGVIIFCLGFVFAQTLIVFAACGDLWLDEIWSINFAEHANKAWDIFSRFKHDNNHVLNTLYIYILGPQDFLIVYRLFSIVAGAFSLLLLGKIAQRWGNFEALSVIVISGTSYPLILYFSEARGYAPAIFFSLMSFFILTSSYERINIQKLIIYWMSIMLGFLAHSTFIIVFVALICHSFANELRMQSSLQNKLYRVCSYNFIPSVFFLSFYLAFIRQVSFGGGPVYSRWAVIGKASSISLGFPEGVLFNSLSMVIVLAVTVIGGCLLYREKKSEWMFYSVVLLVAPAFIISVANPEYLYFRYFLICFPFYYLLISYILGKCYRFWPKKLQWLLAGIIILYIIGQSYRIVPLLRFGRGSYMDTLLYISTKTNGELVTIGSDHDFRNKMLLNFYARFLPGNKDVKYINQNNLYHEAPDWFLLHSQDLSYQPSPFLSIRKAGKYELMNSYPFSGVSGWSWYVYRNASER